MRVSALTPQFVHETPEDPQGDAERVIAFAHDRHHRVEAKAADEPAKQALDEETRAGLRRLGRLIRERSDAGSENRGEQNSERSEGESQDETKEVMKPFGPTEVADLRPQIQLVYSAPAERVVSAYAQAMQAGGREETSGQLLNLAV